MDECYGSASGGTIASVINMIESNSFENLSKIGVCVCVCVCVCVNVYHDYIIPQTYNIINDYTSLFVLFTPTHLTSHLSSLTSHKNSFIPLYHPPQSIGNPHFLNPRSLETGEPAQPTDKSSLTLGSDANSVGYDSIFKKYTMPYIMQVFIKFYLVI